MEMSLFNKIKIAAYCIQRAATKPTFNGFAPHKAEAFYKDPYGAYARMMSDKKIFFCPQQAAWVVAGNYQNVVALLKDERLTPRLDEWRFAPKTPYEEMPPLEQLNANLLMNMHTEDHRRVRRLASPAFNPRQVENLTDDIQALIDEQLDKISGPFNLVDITSAIPHYALAEYIGVDREFHHEFSGLANSISSSYDPTIKVDKDMAMAGLAMMQNLIAEKKKVAQSLIAKFEAQEKDDTSLDDYVAANSKDFLTSLMVKVIKEDEGQKISEEEAMSLIASVLAAGADTTLHHINWAYRGILLNAYIIPDVLADESGKTLQAAITEAYRWDNFAHSGAVRFALEDIELFGQVVKKGEMLRPVVCSMFRDPNVFENPDQFDINRSNLNDVVIFGVGSHFCLGAAMAKKITTLSIKSLLERFPNAQLLSEPVFREHFIIRDMRELMIDPKIS